MHGRGGFDVIIGNPPYVEYSDKKFVYQVDDVTYKTRKAANLYAFVAERSRCLVRSKDSFVGLIVQISSVSTPAMETFCQLQQYDIDKLWVSNYATRPSCLFEGVCMNLTIHIAKTRCEGTPSIWSTQYNRWTSEGRGALFSNICYFEVSRDCLLFKFSIPKLQSMLEAGIVQKLFNEPVLYEVLSNEVTQQRIVYRTAGGRYFKVFTDRDFGSDSKSNKSKYLKQEIDVHEVVAVLSSSLWWVYYTLHFDMYNCKDYMMYNFRYMFGDAQVNKKLCDLGKKLCNDMFANAERKIQTYKATGEREQLLFRPGLSKPIIDEIDELLAKHYGFTEEELDFIINYDIKYRMGDELNA